jgi:outer membrane protein assembly factor BamB
MRRLGCHAGHEDGTSRWRGPEFVGSGWESFERVFPGGEGVIYGVLPDGDLRWHRHDGAADGDSDKWARARIVGNGWSGFHKVFAGGNGVIYTIDTDGVLKRHVHTGYLTGERKWEEARTIGTGFAEFPEVIAGANGVIYIFTRDGRVLRRRWIEREVVIGAASTPGGGGLLTTIDRFLEEAVEVRRGMRGFLRAFTMLESAEPFRTALTVGTLPSPAGGGR